MALIKQHQAHTLSGILFVALFAVLSLYISEISWIASSGINVLVIAILLGIFYSNTLKTNFPQEWAPGIHFSTRQLLRAAIILYGFRINFQQILAVGFEGLIVDIVVVAAVLIIGTFLGTKLFKLDRHTSILISAGSAICGAAAILAVEDILKSEPYKAIVAVGTVVLFGTISMFLYPFLQKSGLLHLTDYQYGLFAGASIHEVAQVVVAGNNVSTEAGDVAVIVKMTRVLLLVPVLFILPLFANQKSNQPTKISVPWFAIYFVLVIGFNSLQLLPASLVNLINQFDLFLLTMAMAAIGMETNLSKIKKVGLKPLYLALILFGGLMGGTWLLIINN